MDNRREIAFSAPGESAKTFQDPCRRFHFSALSEFQRKSTFIANANRRDWFVRIQKRFCRRVDMLAKLSECKRNRCAKPILRRRSPVLSSLAGKFWIPGERSGICPGSHGNPEKTVGSGCTGCPFPRKAVFALRSGIPLRNGRS